MEEIRRSTLAVIVTERERDAVRALAFIENRSISDILYPWVKPHIAAIAQRPDVQVVIGQKERVAEG